MSKTLYCLFLVGMLIHFNTGFCQQSWKTTGSKKLVSIPVIPDSSQNGQFICKIVSFSTANNILRIDAIFAASTESNPLHWKDLSRNIEYEIQQALVFFDSYKTIGEYISPGSCQSLLSYLRAEHTNINKFTLLLPSYATRY